MEVSKSRAQIASKLYRYAQIAIEFISSSGDKLGVKG